MFKEMEGDMIQLKKLFTPVKSMEPEEARKFMAEHEEGKYTLLDVRQPGEYEEEHLPGAKLIPLPKLSDSLKEVDARKPVITYCAIGGRSRVAAQLLSGLGFEEVYNLTGGIKAWQGFKATGPRELNLDLVRGDETPAEIVLLAYGMEKGLQVFYERMSEESKDRELRDLFRELWGIEEQHKKTIFKLQGEVNPPGKDLESLEGDAEGRVMEGGFQMDKFMKENNAFLHSVEDVLTLAMMLETQGLDLYLRLAEKSTNQRTKEVLLKIAQEEKGHLGLLGRKLEKKKG